jgi:hypothetical protein
MRSYLIGTKSCSGPIVGLFLLVKTESLKMLMQMQPLNVQMPTFFTAKHSKREENYHQIFSRTYKVINRD